jgi:lipid II:glycine glycyltransferase (peptidoglycan interpeptide bridge formation enzyme)
VRRWQQAGGEVRLFSARRGRGRGLERIASMLFLVHGRVATYQIGWSGEEGRRLSAHQLCLWEAMRALREAGVRRLDLGTVDTDAAPGLARFKIGAGARVRALGPTCLVLPGVAARLTPPCEATP